MIAEKFIPDPDPAAGNDTWEEDPQERTGEAQLEAYFGQKRQRQVIILLQPRVMILHAYIHVSLTHSPSPACSRVFAILDVVSDAKLPVP